MNRRGNALAVAVAITAGASASVLVSGVSAAGPGCVTQPMTANRVVVTCAGIGGEVALPAGRLVTVDLAGGSGGGVGDAGGGRGAVAHMEWTPASDSVVWALLGPQGAPGVEGRSGGLGGGASIVVPRPYLAQGLTPGPWWLLVAGGGGGRGISPDLGAGGDGGADAHTGAGGDGGGGATGGTQQGAGQGSGGGLPGLGPIGGLGLLGGGSGGSGFTGGGGGGEDGGGGGGGASHANVGTATYAPANQPGDGWARFSWTVPIPPQVTSAATATFVAGQADIFTVSATGDPAPRLTAEGLPDGLTFTDEGDGNGVISGRPPVGYGGDFLVTVRASNGTGPDAVQQLQLHIAVPRSGSRSDPPPPLSPDLTPPVQTTENQEQPELVPVAAKTVVVTPVSGTVMIRRPDGTLTELTAGEEIPVGSVVDTRDGVVELTAARGAGGGTVQTALFWNAIFRVSQQADAAAGGARAAASAQRKLLTTLKLEQRPSGCRGKARAAARKPTGGLWGDGHGRFRVRGNSSSATVRGTKWYVENRCDGTYTRVVRGVVAVRDFVHKKTIVLRAGRTYTARRPGS